MTDRMGFMFRHPLAPRKSDRSSTETDSLARMETSARFSDFPGLENEAVRFLRDGLGEWLGATIQIDETGGKTILVAVPVHQDTFGCSIWYPLSEQAEDVADLILSRVDKDAARSVRFMSPEGAPIQPTSRLPTAR